MGYPAWYYKQARGTSAGGIQSTREYGRKETDRAKNHGQMVMMMMMMQVHVQMLECSAVCG